MRNILATIVLLIGLLAGCAAAPVETSAGYEYTPAENVVYYMYSDEGLAEFYNRACPYVDGETPIGKYLHDGYAVAGYGRMQPFCWFLFEDTRIGILIPGSDGGYVTQDQVKRGPAPVPPAMPEQPKGTEV